MNSDIKEHNEHATLHGLSSAESASLNDLLYWRPIDTAPKDGTEILLCTAVLHDIGLCYWREDEVMTGWTWGLEQKFLRPAYWMPLPPPPTAI